MASTLRTVLEQRQIASAVVATTIWSFVSTRYPFPENEPYLALLKEVRPHISDVIRFTYTLLWFTTPLLIASSLLSLAYIFLVRQGRPAASPQLPRYPNPATRRDLSVVIGEVHRTQHVEPVPRPTWLAIPARGLFTGVAIFGAVGSGKTSGCMYPFAEQILSFRRDDRERRPGALMLEVKGDFCHRIREILERHGRGDDYVEISLSCEYRYNPLHNDLEAYALAYGIASLLTNLFGRGKEPFWQQAYTNLVKFIILLHKAAFDYVTLFDVYECAINPDLLAARIERARGRFEPTRSILLDPQDYTGRDELKELGFKLDSELGRMKAPYSEELFLKVQGFGFKPETSEYSESGSEPILDEIKREQFAAVSRWFHHDWMRIEPKLRTSIVEGISVFLSLFDDNPAVKRTFCPPKECYDPVANAHGKYGKPLPAFSDLIESGAVVARSDEWVFSPERDYEIVGDVDKVVFPCGWILRDGEVWLYYGGADKCIALATARLPELLEWLAEHNSLD